MRPPCARSVLLAIFLLLAGGPARAIEALQIGTSADRIEIAAEFSGGEFVVFGFIENGEDEPIRQGSYDIVVVLEGPRVPVVVRRKERVLGFWINRVSEALDLAPASYILASTHDIDAIVSASTRRQLALGTQDVRLSQAAAATPPAAGSDAFTEAFLAIKERAGLYNQDAGAVAFVAPALFRAKLALPRDLPVGRHLVRVLLLLDGNYLAESSRPLWVTMTGLEGSVQQYATDYPWRYGFWAVLLAMFVGWSGRVAFRRD